MQHITFPLLSHFALVVLLSLFFTFIIYFLFCCHWNRPYDLVVASLSAKEKKNNMENGLINQRSKSTDYYPKISVQTPKGTVFWILTLLSEVLRLKFAQEILSHYFDKTNLKTENLFYFFMNTD